MYPRRWNPVKVVVRPLAAAEQVDGYWERGGDDQFEDPIEMSGQPNFKRSRWAELDHGYAGDQQEVAPIDHLDGVRPAILNTDPGLLGTDVRPG